MKFKSKVFLAPMADVTDSAFRILCAKYGAGLTYTEMISSTALARKKENKLFFKYAWMVCIYCDFFNNGFLFRDSYY